MIAKSFAANHNLLVLEDRFFQSRASYICIPALWESPW